MKTENAVKHTPGPWHIGMQPGPMIYGPKGEQVADLTAELLPDSETAGNARLIAAAPELLAACVEVLKMAQVHDARTGFYAPIDPYEAQKILRAAIAKARGE